MHKCSSNPYWTNPMTNHLQFPTVSNQEVIMKKIEPHHHWQCHRNNKVCGNLRVTPGYLLYPVNLQDCPRLNPLQQHEGWKKMSKTLWASFKQEEIRIWMQMHYTDNFSQRVSHCSNPMNLQHRRHHTDKYYQEGNKSLFQLHCHRYTNLVSLRPLRLPQSQLLCQWSFPTHTLQHAHTRTLVQRRHFKWTTA